MVADAEVLKVVTEILDDLDLGDALDPAFSAAPQPKLLELAQDDIARNSRAWVDAALAALQ